MVRATPEILVGTLLANREAPSGVRVLARLVRQADLPPPPEDGESNEEFARPVGLFDFLVAQCSHRRRLTPVQREGCMEFVAGLADQQLAYVIGRNIRHLSRIALLEMMRRNTAQIEAAQRQDKLRAVGHQLSLFTGRRAAGEPRPKSSTARQMLLFN